MLGDRVGFAHPEVDAAEPVRLDWPMLTSSTGLRLESAHRGAELTDLEAINEALLPNGARVWRRDLTTEPENIRALVGQTTLDEEEQARVLDHFLLSRQRILEIVEEAGRTPETPDGGEMSTLDATHGITYPQLYLVEPGIDYSRFDRLHINTSDTGLGVDEVMQVLSGSGVRLIQILPEHGPVTLHIDCPSQDVAWTVTYSGAFPHVGSISGCSTGSKIHMQVIGTPEWQMRYVDD